MFNNNNFSGNNNFNNNNNGGQQKRETVGAVWAVQSNKTGNQYLNITIDGVGQFIAFQNSYKNSPNQPDFRIFKKENAQTQQPPMRKQTFNQNNNNFNNNFQQQNFQQPVQQQTQQQPNNMQQNNQQQPEFQASNDEFKDLNLF